MFLMDIVMKQLIKSILNHLKGVAEVKLVLQQMWCSMRRSMLQCCKNDLYLMNAISITLSPC